MASRRHEGIAGRVPRLAFAAVTTVLLGVLAWELWGAVSGFVATAQAWLPYPYPRPGSEGLMLYETLLMRGGADLYGPITQSSFISGPYPPVYLWLAGRVMPAVPGFFDGRSISMWAALAVAALAAGSVTVSACANSERDTRPTGRLLALGGLAGLIAAGLWLACPPVQIWATRFRADMLMMAFMAAGLFCVVLGSVSPRSPSFVLTWLGIPFFVLALYTKQTAIAGPMAAAAYLLVRDWKRGLAWVAGLGIVGGLPFLALNLSSDGWFYLKMVSYHSLPWSWPTLSRLLVAWQEDHLLLILAALGYAAWTIRSRRNDPLTWYLLATLLTLPTAGVVGADHNHLLPVDLALVLALGAALAASVSRQPPEGNTQSAIRNPHYVLRFAFCALLLAAIGFLQMASTPADWYGPDMAMPGADVQRQLHKIVEMVRAGPPGKYFADDPGLLALASKTTDYDDPFTMTALAAAGRWDASTLEAQFREGSFPIVMLAGDVSDPPHVPLRADILTPEMRAALRSGYRILYPDVYFTYVPRR
ncbi:MAG: hypothetical protein ACR2M0_03265 [Chloroflexia bacterium]